MKVTTLVVCSFLLVYLSEAAEEATEAPFPTLEQIEDFGRRIDEFANATRDKAKEVSDRFGKLSREGYAKMQTVSDKIGGQYVQKTQVVTSSDGKKQVTHQGGGYPASLDHGHRSVSLEKDHSHQSDDRERYHQQQQGQNGREQYNVNQAGRHSQRDDDQERYHLRQEGNRVNGAENQQYQVSQDREQDHHVNERAQYQVNQEGNNVNGPQNQQYQASKDREQDHHVNERAHYQIRQEGRY